MRDQVQRVQEPYPYLHSCAVLALALVVVGGIEAGKALRRIWRGATGR